MTIVTSKTAATIMSARDVNQFLGGMDLTENTWVLIGGMRSSLPQRSRRPWQLLPVLHPRITS